MNNQESVSPLVEGGKNGQPKKPELVLWFYCTHCGRVLQVPLRSLGQKAACLSCKTRLIIPTLHRDIAGMDVVQHFFDAAQTAVPANEPCPEVPASAFFRDMDPPSEPPATTAPIPPAPSSPSPLQSLPLNAGPHRSPLTPPQLPSRPQPSQPAAGLVTPEVVPERQLGVEPHAVYDGRQRQSRGGGLRIPRIAFWTTIAIHWIGLFILFMCALIIHPIFLLFFLIWLILAAFRISIPRMITPFFINSFSCPGCGETYPCVEVWKCTCGYQDHRERHILRFKCPLCHNRIGRTDCVHCGATILLW